MFVHGASVCTNQWRLQRSMSVGPLRAGRCAGQGSCIVHKVEVPKELVCPACGEIFKNLPDLLSHVVTHVQLPNAQGREQ